MVIDETSIDAIRVLVGDNDAASQLLDDDSILLVTAGYSSLRLAAAAVADAIAAKFSRKVSFSLEGLRFENSTKAEAYLKLAERLRLQAASEEAGNIGISVTGISKAAMDTVSDDTDREPAVFEVGMQQDPPTRG